MKTLKYALKTLDISIKRIYSFNSIIFSRATNKHANANIHNTYEMQGSKLC